MGKEKRKLKNCLQRISHHSDQSCVFEIDKMLYSHQVIIKIDCQIQRGNVTLNMIIV